MSKREGSRVEKKSDRSSGPGLKNWFNDLELDEARKIERQR
jgi:hypothetical protein